uniref:Uncharacterized protein LOC111123537 n=1 Tax=Crassostrea virginica TaxID=6565 RepID=A0A8B8D495_CRAVI|nr:uncharacterized protein LOC111123537 [Crassostrea virginica]XP_022321679.1 uncharacterized protein LOC111123563 [Crassostrea virginica]
MKGYLRTVVLMYSMCCVFSLPLHRLIRRNVTNEKKNDTDFHVDVLADHIFETVARGRGQITHDDIVDYYKREWGYDDYRASEISFRYLLWGDRNGDHELTKDELKTALRNHYN